MHTIAAAAFRYAVIPALWAAFLVALFVALNMAVEKALEAEDARDTLADL